MEPKRMMMARPAVQAFMGTVVFVLWAMCAAFLQAQTTAYVDVRIETATDQGVIEKGTVLVRDGKIAEVGETVTIPGDAKVVSLSGKTIMPTLIDPYFVYQQGQGGGDSETRTITINGRTIQIPGRGTSTTAPFQWISDYFYPYEFDFRPSVRSGIGVANLVSNGQGVSALAELKVDPDPSMVFQEKGFVFSQISNQTSSLDTLRRPLSGNRGRGGSPATGGSSRAGSGSNGSGGTASGNGTSPASADKTSQAWDAVRTGKEPVFVNVSNAATVAYVMQLMEKQKDVQWVLVSTGSNLFELVDQLKGKKNLTVVLEPGLSRVPYTTELTNVGQMLEQRQVPFAISLSLAGPQLRSLQDDPLFPLAMLIKTGMSRKTAIQSVTLSPAKVLKLDQRMGTLEKGKDASFLIFEGDPLEVGSRLNQVVQQGVVTYEN